MMFNSGIISFVWDEKSTHLTVPEIKALRMNNQFFRHVVVNGPSQLKPPVALEESELSMANIKATALGNSSVNVLLHHLRIAQLPAATWTGSRNMLLHKILRNGTGEFQIGTTVLFFFFFFIIIIMKRILHSSFLIEFSQWIPLSGARVLPVFQVTDVTLSFSALNKINSRLDVPQRWKAKELPEPEPCPAFSWIMRK